MFTRSIKNASAGIALAAALALGTGGAAFAHECFNTSRSDQGDAMAGSKSQAWTTIAVADLIQSDVDSGAYTQEQGDCVKAAYAASGAPSSFTVMIKGAVGQHGLIAGRNPNPELASDGHGIDHVLAAYGDQIFGSFAACGVEF